MTGSVARQASGPGPSAPAPACRDGGAGLISTIAGVLVFLAFLLFVVQTLFALYTRSVVTDAAHEAVRRTAGARVDQGDPSAVEAARRDAEAEARRLLGRFVDEVELDWSASTADTVSLTVRAEPPSFLWNALRGPWSGIVERTVTARVEVLR
jgi:Flp pilus assembly protein TadG